MAIKLPQLDDKTYADLVEEARTTIPTVYPAWTDHNPSDPGITLVEMFAWLTEMMVYRTGRIPEASERTFLKLLGCKQYADEDIDEARAKKLSDLRERYRAVTPEDYEFLVLSQWGDPPLIARAHCIPGIEIQTKEIIRSLRHITLVVLPRGNPPAPWVSITEEQCNAILEFFRPRNLITTQLHVVGVSPVPITLKATIHLRDDAPSNTETVRTSIQLALLAHFDPLTGGPSGLGWPFGRQVDLADVLAVIDAVPGVEFVSTEPGTLGLAAEEDYRVKKSRRIPPEVTSQLLGVRIEPYELPRFSKDNAQMDLTFKRRRGNVWL